MAPGVGGQGNRGLSRAPWGPKCPREGARAPWAPRPPTPWAPGRPQAGPPGGPGGGWGFWVGCVHCGMGEPNATIPLWGDRSAVGWLYKAKSHTTCWLDPLPCCLDLQQCPHSGEDSSLGCMDQDLGPLGPIPVCQLHNAPLWQLHNVPLLIGDDQ